MSGDDRETWDAQDLIQWQEARRWLTKADEDLLAAQRLLPEIIDQAAFHVQQAMEKTLKALMVASDKKSARRMTYRCWCHWFARYRQNLSRSISRLSNSTNGIWRVAILASRR